MKLTPGTEATMTADELKSDLQRQRLLADARRDDELKRLQAQAAHDRQRADVAEDNRRAEKERAEREADRDADARLARLYRDAMARGERTRIAAELSRSAEARALRVERVRVLNLRILLPVLCGFGLWSTIGVQHGAALMMGVTSADAMWWALFLLEPVLIGAVVWVIVARTRLRASGGQMRPGAETIAWSCLGTSIGLNLVSSLPTGTPAGGWDAWAVLSVVGAMAAHAIGPLGAAATAHLIGEIDESASSTDPWKGAPRLADMGIAPPAAHTPDRPDAPAAESAPDDDRDSTSESALPPALKWVSVPDGARVLPLIARPAAPAVEEPEQPGSRTGADQQKPGGSKAPSKTRPNRGAKVPRSARPPSARSLSDEELADRLDALTTAGDLPQGAPVRRVQSALGIGFERAKRVTELRKQRTTDAEPTLSLVGPDAS